MAKGHKKGPKNRQNAAGDSRISILTEENDNYNPFKDIKKMDVVKKVDIQTKQKKSNSKPKNEKIIEIDENVSFEDIFNQWENVGTLNSKKKKRNEEKEDFASIFNQWEVSQGLKPKYSKKAKDAPNRKKSNYIPKKDFSQILDEFEGKPASNKQANQKPQQKKSNKKETPKKEISSLNLNSNDKVVSTSKKNKSNYTPKKDFADILNEFENKPNEKKTEIKENKTLEQKIKEKKQITTFSKNETKGNSLETIKVEASTKANSNTNQKTEANKEDSSKKDFGKILEEFEKKIPEKTISKDNIKLTETTHKDNEYSKYKKSENDNNCKSHLNNKNDKKDNHFNKKREKREKRDYKPKESNIDPKWDFSNIYGAWESKNDEAKQIEEKKNSEKKESKGISISYLRSMSPEDELDLHGFTSDIAALKVSEFLKDSRDKGYKKVSIITGKGNHSENGKSVIKEIVLDEIKYSDIVREAYHPKAIHGGSGAIWVIFKSKSEKKIYF